MTDAELDERAREAWRQGSDMVSLRLSEVRNDWKRASAVKFSRGQRVTLSRPLQRAVEWLQQRGGSGVVDCYGRVVAAGEVAVSIDSTTWLRLVAKGALRGDGGRVELTVGGEGE